MPKRGRLENNDTVLTAYNGQPIHQYGTLRLRCSHAANKCEAMFFVADMPGPATIGLPSRRGVSLEVLNSEITQTAQINTKDDLQRQYPDRSEGIGKFRGDFHITLDPTVTPVIHAVRQCSIHLKDEVKTELDNMEELGVIERVTERNDCVASRKLSGKLRETAFERTKALICRQTTLKYFDPGAESVIQVYASSRGMGAVLMQKWKPIAFASKSLSDAETRYTNNGREMLAVVFGCERFHTYVFGKSVTIESDHRPLEMIHLNNLSAAPQRLQRMLLRIHPYAITIRYRPGE